MSAEPAEPAAGTKPGDPESGKPRGAADGTSAEAQGTGSQGAESPGTGPQGAGRTGAHPAGAEAEEPDGDEGEQQEEGEGEQPEEGEGEDAVSAPGPDGEPVRTTRRFPRVTRDTARPEGGGRAAGGDAPAPARQWPLLTVLVTIGVGLLLVAFDVTRVGLLLVGIALLGGAVMRWCVRSVGMLAVRSRFTDMLTYGVLGFLITLLALMVQPDPWLKLPFLEGLMHFTVR
ncbi:DUF3017 domain-containing protein [Streptomyces sp. SID10853]|uniref:DUF3017 domain-containing protein n=1 Tax=Streptomyces sp. SID10853 TaxID=2706028 RepID=UPI0013C00B24|nr:DUF3017 domain-containing protein [Streptomyces sp. SID10853]